MTIARFLFGTLVATILFIVTKVFFINLLNIDSRLFVYVLWFVLAIETIAIVRRLGILNYLESFFIIIVWLICSLILDLLITTAIVGRDVYTEWYFWINYIVMAVAVIVFHKKVHIHARRMYAAKNKQ